MLLGPIFHVEMVSVARRRRYFLLRVVYGALALFVLWTSYTNVRWRIEDSAGPISIQAGQVLASTFFYSFTVLQIVAILVVGPAMAAGTIAVERERRTIEYLFATDLANHEIILGKTITKLCLLGKLLLVGLPILFIFRMLGGIPASLLLSVFLISGSTAVFLTAISVCISVWSPRARDATIRVYILLAALFFLPTLFRLFGAWGWMNNQWWEMLAEPVIDFCIAINPLWVLGRSIGSRTAIGIGLDSSLILTSVFWQSVVSIFCLFMATFAVRRVHLRETTRIASMRLRSRWIRLPKWRPALGDQPMLWKEISAVTADSRFGFAGFVAMALILSTVVGVTINMYFTAEIRSFNSGLADEYIYFLGGLSGLFGSGILLLLAARAAGLVTHERERECWASLMATPLSGKEILHGKMWGNLYSARWPAFILASAWMLGITRDLYFVFAAIALAITLLLAAWYATTLGLYFSLRSQATIRAMGATLATFVFFGGGYLFCCCSVAFIGSGAGLDEGIFFAPCVPFLLGFPPISYMVLAVDEAWFRENPGFPIAYVLGLIGYLLAGAALHSSMIFSFNHWSGRCVKWPDQPFSTGDEASSAL